MFYIYRHIVPNGKSYIGKTKLKPNIRFNNGKGYKKCPKFYKAIEKYGWKNIKHEILFITDDECEARKLEKEMIEQYNSINNGYNSVNKKWFYVSKRKTPLPIYKQYTKDGEFIKEYIGNTELTKSKFLPERVRACCRGTIKTSYGYVWKVE